MRVDGTVNDEQANAEPRAAMQKSYLRVLEC